jgi:hypothetical protein
MSSFNPDDYGLTLAPLLQPRLMTLDAGSPNVAVRPHLEALGDLAFLGKPIKDRDMARACVAGLWLYHDFLDESHAISQELHTPEGSYWHAIMHRREGDFSNSKYWFRRVGSHPVLRQLTEQAPALGHEFADPFAFVDLVERVLDSGTPDEEVARRAQNLEWQLLFDWCYRKALHG